METRLYRGRCIAVDPPEILIRNETGQLRVRISNPSDVQRGDIVEVQEKRKGEKGLARVLTPNRKPNRTTQWLEHTLDPRRLKALDCRSRVEASIREFFLAQGFRETRTPTMVPCPGMEPHIRPFEVARPEGSAPLFLPTSPEFAMKRLLVGGLEKIFQMSPSFRDEPRSVTHRPEFLMLEWYRAYAGYRDIMRDTEELFAFVANRLFGKPEFRYRGETISVRTPWPRLKVRDLFKEFAGVDLVAASEREDLARECVRLDLPPREGENWDDLYFKIWLNRIEPRLPADQAVFVTDYPPSQAALAVVAPAPDGTPWARRFELYAGGLELGNAFEELTDPVEQRARFIKDMELREQVYGKEFAKTPLDEEFLQALEEGLPPSGGIAIGVDRMVMLFADEPDLAYTAWL